jgi:hypothetical protein
VSGGCKNGEGQQAAEQAAGRRAAGGHDKMWGVAGNGGGYGGSLGGGTAGGWRRGEGGVTVSRPSQESGLGAKKGLDSTAREEPMSRLEGVRNSP